jgi:hypothetical protein
MSSSRSKDIVRVERIGEMSQEIRDLQTELKTIMLVLSAIFGGLVVLLCHIVVTRLLLVVGKGARGDGGVAQYTRACDSIRADPTAL